MIIATELETAEPTIIANALQLQASFWPSRAISRQRATETNSSHVAKPPWCDIPGEQSDKPTPFAREDCALHLRCNTAWQVAQIRVGEGLI